MNAPRKPNLKGRRFRKLWMTLLTRDNLSIFKEKYPEYVDLTFTEFKNAIMTFNGKITAGVIENRNGVELPDGLGFIFMGTCPATKKRVIDYKKSFDTGVSVTHKNWDSDNKLLKIFYTNRPTKYPFQNKQVWAFNAVKQFRHNASVAYKEDFTKYIEVSPNIKISTMFDRFRKKLYIQNLKPVIPEEYNEFKL